MDSANEKERLILLTGASGYVGGRALKALESSGRRVRCLVRRPASIKKTGIGSKISFLCGDVLKSDLRDAMEGVDTAYYLIHSMGSEGSFEEQDRQAARNFGEAARRAGVRRIIYLGGLGYGKESLSPHLESRHETGDILRESGVQVIEFRASIVIGSGSLSFEMIRSLVERLPVMITPRWVSVSAQPIAVDDLLQYLLAALELPVEGNMIFEIGGADVVSYGEIMKEYARMRGLRRLTISVPVLTPRLSSLWLSLVTPLHAQIGRKLIDSIRHPTIVRDRSAIDAFNIRPKGLRESIESALSEEDRELSEMKWSEALSSAEPRKDWRNVRIGNRLIDSRITKVDLPPAAAFRPIRRIGGSVGWYYGNWLWRLRGFIDSMAGGVGFRRGRSDQDKLKVGDAVDFWRVEAIEPDKRLRLAAEMNLPGRAWLEFEVESGSSSSTIRQTAVFDPVGLCGLLYWYALYPLHELVFSGMLRGIEEAAVSLEKKSMKSPVNQWLALAGFIAVCFVAAGIGSMLTAPYINGWYATLRKPWWNPPSWLFGPVWTLLYCAMATAAWLVWRRSGFSGAALPFTLFFVQLVLNAAWSGFFFALRNPPAAFVNIVLLWAAIAATGVSFWNIVPTAGWLMAPYLAWVTFAAALNYTLWKLNP